MSAAAFPLLNVADSAEKQPSPKSFREECSFRSLNSRFQVSQADYASQYAGIYFCRLQALYNQTRTRAIQEWPGVEHKTSISDLEPGARCFIIGALFKNMKLKRAALQAFLEDVEVPTGPDGGFCSTGRALSEDDELFIEDTSGRLKILCDSKLRNQSVSGEIVALVGAVEENGAFKGEAVVYPGVISVELPVLSGGSKWIAFVTDMSILDPNIDKRAFQRLQSILEGSVSIDGVDSQSILKLYILGNLLKDAHQQLEQSKDLTMMDYADCLMSCMAATIPVDVIPGDKDPTGNSWPQIRLSSYLWPRAKRYATFNCVTNPYYCEIDSKFRVLFMTSKSVDDFSVYTSHEKPSGKNEGFGAKCFADILEHFVEDLRCIAPTAPDTLSCYPFKANDPFTFDKDEGYPHIIVCGGCKLSTYDVRETKGGRFCIMVPSFSPQNPCMYLFDLVSKTLKAVNLLNRNTDLEENTNG